MKAMILAAGRGERMRPLTDTTPKPLLKVGGKALIEYHIQALAKAGIRDLVINHAWLGGQIEGFLKDGHKYGVDIVYSREEQALETAGGIVRALSLLGQEPFIVVNGDIFTDYPFARLLSQTLSGTLAHLVMVDNPRHHPRGDFFLDHHRVYDDGEHKTNKLTFSGIALYSPALFKSLSIEKYPLAPLLKQFMPNGQVSGEYYKGTWQDIGTPQRLRELDQQIQ